jgi:hypothetical protein
MPLLHDPGGDRVIDELFAFLSIDPDGKTGICASILPGLGSTPLVTGSPEAAELMRRIAADVARASGKRVEMWRFTRDKSGPLWASGRQ